MRRTQIYLDDDLWNALRIQARETGHTMSELIRASARDRYLHERETRKQAMLALVGLRKDQPGLEDSTKYVRKLRRGSRLRRLHP